MATLDPERWAAASPYLDQVSSSPKPSAALVGSPARSTASHRCGSRRSPREHAAVADEHFLEENLPPIPSPALTGQKFGPYTLKSAIGHGGMGSVWLAERSDGRFERGGGQVPQRGRSRARREIAIQDRGTNSRAVDASQIAQLLDAGVSPGDSHSSSSSTSMARSSTSARRTLDVQARMFSSGTSWRPSPTPMQTWSSTATSSRRTCWSRKRGKSSCSTSGLPSFSSMKPVTHRVRGDARVRRCAHPSTGTGTDHG